jgi:uncharacterized protein YndB with AHSA1/START domain
VSASDDLVVERRVDAAPATIFRFLNDPARWIRWQGIEADIEPRPGGRFRVNVTGDGFASGEFVEIIPNRRVVFTWGWESPDSPVPPGSTTVAIDLIPDGDKTIIRLTHSQLPPPTRQTHKHGWNNYADRLAAVAEGREPGPDPLRVDS